MSSLAEESHEILIRPGHGIKWAGSGGKIQTITANPEGDGFAVETEMNVPPFEDGSGIPTLIVVNQIVKGSIFGTNFNGVAAIFKILEG